MKPRQATAYLKGIRAARRSELRPDEKPPRCPYELQSLANYWRRGLQDYEDDRENALYFLHYAEGRF